MRKRSISGKIRSVIRNNTTLDYYYSCIENRKDQCIRDFVRQNSTNVLKIENSQMPCNIKDGIYYFINTGNDYSGFGAEFRRTLDGLFFADHYGLVPVVLYNKDYIYSEDTLINGTDNPFEYYFCQPAGIEIDSMSSSQFVYFKEEHRQLVEKQNNIMPPYEINEEYIATLGEIVKKYIRLNSEVEKYISQSLSVLGIGEGQVIGVHYRGTDFKEGRKKHPKMVHLNDYISSVETILNRSNEEIKIFLATDDQVAIDEFVKRYGERVLYFKDTFRSQNGQPVHFSNNDRKYHKYTLGLEILRDIIALSKCDFLVSGLSQVSFAARIFKESRDEHYIQKCILDKGIN